MSKRRNRPQRDHKQPILQPITRRKLVIVHAHELTLEDIDTESLLVIVKVKINGEK